MNSEGNARIEKNEEKKLRKSLSFEYLKVVYFLSDLYPFRFK